MLIGYLIAGLVGCIAIACASAFLPAAVQTASGSQIGIKISGIGSSNSIGAEIQEYFAPNYAASRKKFLGAANTAGATVESFQHPSTGPDGAPLFTDVAVLGSPAAKAVLIVGAGTHGVEAFAGAAIQIGLLRQRYETRLGADTRLVLIHGINPYGFAHLRRANEDNVDLNRNFRDHGKPYPENPGYAALATAIMPKATSVVADITAISRILFHAARNGWNETKAALTGGQYTHPQGLFYGGKFESWSAKTLRTIVQRHGNGAKDLAFVDVHTGLGPHGHAEIILNMPKDTPAYKRAVAWWGDWVKSTKTGESVSADLDGTLKLAIPKMLPGAEITAVSLEFGTVSSLVALWALRAENWLHHHGDRKNPDAKRIKLKLRRAFYPDSEDWRSTVWRQGKKTVDKALYGLSKTFVDDKLSGIQGREK
jgi:hypothetical protein